MPKICCARKAFDERPCNRSSHYCEGSEALATLWVDVPVDILGVVVLRLLACVADRASVRSP